MTACAVKLLGGFAFLIEGRPTALSTRKDKLLLGYLCLNAGRPITRDRLAALLWSDRGEEQARGSLRQSLATVRSAFHGLPVQPLEAGRDAVAFSLAGIACDVLDFQQAVEAMAPPAKVLALYGGTLLEGFDAPSPEFAQWLMPIRQQLEDQAASYVESLAFAALSPEDIKSAIVLARRLLGRDGLREVLWQTLMHLLVLDNRKIEALKAFSECSAVLSQELGIKPSRPTEDLYRDILTDQYASSDAQPRVPPAKRDRPSIAVMPFRNISRDPTLDRLCEGLAEEVISGLSRFKLLSVIDRYSSTKVAESASDMKEIGERLGVDFVVQGSLQRLTDQIRITVSLVEATSRQQKWSNQYNCTEADILSAPDRISAAMIVRLNEQAENTLLERSRRKPVLAAYECFLQGLRHIRGYAADDNIKAIECFDKAIAIDPDFALAIAYRGFADLVLHGYDSTPRDILEASLRKINDAARLEPDNPRISWLMGVVQGYLGDFRGEMQAYRRALELNPNDANAMESLGAALATAGNPEEGIAMMRQAMRLNPYHPEWYWITLGRVLYSCRRYEEAADVLLPRHRNTVYAMCRLAAALAQLGRKAEAAEMVDKILQQRPSFRVSQFSSNYWGPEESAHLRDGLRKAGLPE